MKPKLPGPSCQSWRFLGEEGRAQVTGTELPIVEVIRGRREGPSRRDRVANRGGY